ncbi:TPA: hypothetical protein QH928_000907 [Klebsiella pneumoniae subsp. pneumoniae]|nr:hypothetical protein [Klebsiella pneumoniae subsp. pneumoniae]
MSKLFGDKQHQTASGGSVAIQASGNVNYSGLSYGEVKEICIDLMKANFPILREDARQLSMAYVEEFGKKFFDRIKAEDQEKSKEKFKSPDIQAAINTSVLHVARMTDKSHQDILCELLVEKIKEDKDDENRLINEAIEITSNITINQIRFITFIYLLRNVYPIKRVEGKVVRNDDKEVQFNHFENYIADVISDEVYSVDTDFLVFKGLCVMYTGAYQFHTALLSVLRDSTGRPVSPFMGEESIVDGDAFSSNFPRLASLIVKFGFNFAAKVDAIQITRLSEVIAGSYLRTKGILK